jgi:hypothetical protein
VGVVNWTESGVGAVRGEAGRLRTM